jgi:hypothetical protein
MAQQAAVCDDPDGVTILAILENNIMLAGPMKNHKLQFTAVLTLFAAALASRLYTPFAATHNIWLENFSPLAAICLCGAIYFPRKLAVLLPLGIILVSDVILNAYVYHASLFCWEMFSRYVALGLVIGLGWAVRKQGRLWPVIPASIAGSLGFYIITNSASWISNPVYQKTLAGWVQALTTGVPAYPPTWLFYRSTLVSDLLFTGLFVLCMVATASRAADVEAAGRPATSLS